MKKLKTLLMVLVFGLIGFTSCEKDDVEPVRYNGVIRYWGIDVDDNGDEIENNIYLIIEKEYDKKICDKFYFVEDKWFNSLNNKPIDKDEWDGYRELLNGIVHDVYTINENPWKNSTESYTNIGTVTKDIGNRHLEIKNDKSDNKMEFEMKFNSMGGINYNEYYEWLVSINGDDDWVSLTRNNWYDIKLDTTKLKNKSHRTW